MAFEPINLTLNTPETVDTPTAASSVASSPLQYQPTPLAPTSGFSSGVIVQQKYNDLIHKVEMYLDNSGTFDGTRRFHINPSAVVNLSITDKISDWVVDGSMIMLYTPEEVDPSSKDLTGQSAQTIIKGAQENAKLLKNYQFRGDGFDLLRIMIYPIPSKGRIKNEVEIKENEPKWILSYLFSIYDVDDLSEVPGVVGAAAPYLKCLRLNFHDVRYQILRTTNLEYSTGLSPKADYVPGFANGGSSIGGQGGVLHTGDAILEILNEALSKPDEGKGSLEFYQLPGDEDWNQGQSQIFYTSPAGYSASDDIDYLLANHVGPPVLENSGRPLNDLCLMHTKRPNSPGLLEPICLSPLTNFFKKATLNGGGEEPGELQLEHFFVTDHADSKFHPTKTHKAPMKKPGTGNDTIDLQTAKHGQILTYSFVDMSPEVNSTVFTTTPVYSVDIGKRQFNIQFQDNNIETAREVIAEQYISKLFKKGIDNKKLFLPTLHKTKKDLNIFPTFTLNGDNPIVRQKNGFHHLLYTGLFQNACICFKTLGLTLRESGSFIAIDKTLGSEDNDFANKLFGQWFVVRVDHVFETGSYLNVIWAVKIHRFNERKADFGSTLE